MPQKESEAVPEDNGPVPQQEEFGSGEPTLADVYRLCEERFDRQQKIMDSCSDRTLDGIIMKTRGTSQREASLEHDARQSRLAMEADGSVNTKTRERTEGAPTKYKRYVGIAFPFAGWNPARRSTRPVSAWWPNLPLSLVGTAFWSRTALRRPSRVSHPWRCAQHQPPVAYSPPATPLQQRRPPSTSHFFGSTRPRIRILRRKLKDFNFISLVRQQLLETACCPLLPEGYRDKIDAK